MKIALFIFIIGALIYSSVSGYFLSKKLIGQDITEQIRLKFYRSTLLEQWLGLALIFVFSFLDCFSLQEIGLQSIHLGKPLWFSVVICVLGIAVFLLCLYQIIMCLISSEYQKKATEHLKLLEQKGNYYDVIISKLMLPETKKEKLGFSFISLFAGIFEEILFRGCLIFLLTSLFPALSFLAAGLLTCLMFAFAHIYQGPFGVLKTGLIGVFFLLLYITTGSLFPGILLHFVVDFSSTFLLKEEKPESSKEKPALE